jgi:hypothetical protein
MMSIGLHHVAECLMRRIDLARSFAQQVAKP